MTLTELLSRTVRRYLFCILAVCLVFGAAPDAQAAYQTEPLPTADVFRDFVVGPGKVELTLAPGESRTVEVIVSNRMGDERLFNIQVEDIKGSDDPEQTVVLLGDDRGPYSLRDYVSFAESSFVLPHATRARIPVTVSVPANAAPGGHYGSVLFTTTSHRTDQDAAFGSTGGTAIVSRIGVLFFITVPGPVAAEGALERFSVRGAQRFFTSGPVPFQLSFRNSGTIHLNPSGVIEVTNMLGRTVETIAVEPWFTLPQSLRLREVSWEAAGLAGRYTATVTVNRGYGGLTDTATVTFWVIPLVPIAIAIAALFALLFILRFIVRRFEIRRK